MQTRKHLKTEIDRNYCEYFHFNIYQNYVFKAWLENKNRSPCNYIEHLDHLKPLIITKIYNESCLDLNRLKIKYQGHGKVIMINQLFSTKCIYVGQN